MPKTDKHLYEFGPFRIDSVERLLLRGDSTIPLTPKAVDTLLALLANAGRIVEKDELIKIVWPDTFVEEGALARNVSALRKALGDDADGARYVETIPKRGYRFIGAVNDASPELHLAARTGTAPASPLPESRTGPTQKVRRKVAFLLGPE